MLTLEFSHCFDVRTVSSTPAGFMRANINQAAILFSGQVRVELHYRYTPWQCRLRDIADARRLKLAEVGWPD